MFSDSVNLQADVAFRMSFIDFFIGQISHRNSVDEGFDVCTFGDDFEAVPFAIFHVVVGVTFVLWLR